MELNKYQDEAYKTAIYPKASGIEYVALNLAGESGEFAGHLAKAFRDDDYGKTREFTQERKSLLVKELGDVLWHIAAAGKELGVTLSEIAEVNLIKLKHRQKAGTLGGSGDNR